MKKELTKSELNYYKKDAMFECNEIARFINRYLDYSKKQSKEYSKLILNVMIKEINSKKWQKKMVKEINKDY